MKTKIGTMPPGLRRSGQLPPDLRSRLGPRALLALALESVQYTNAAELAEARRTQRPGRPEVFITLLTYCYLAGISDSRDVEWATRVDPTVRYICAGERPDWQTIRRFRRLHRGLLRDSLLHVLKQTWAFHFETGEADYVGYEWFESELIDELKETANARLDLAALLDGADAD